MHFKIDELISYASSFIQFNEGDLIMTGTPNGVGGVKIGDQIEAFGRIGEKVVASLQF
jgi:2-keto-4-pentenoate hydratase/2-oxohepta-3-ene-1,7-dioic acid hydratase in catechol pathway